MKLLLLTLCCVVATSLAGPFSAKEEKLEAALHDIEAVLQDLTPVEGTLQDMTPDEGTTNSHYFGDLPKPIESVKSLDMEEIFMYTENIEKATAEVEAIGGRVAIQMGDNILIANVPADVVSKQDAFVHSSPSVPSTASEIARHNAEAYEMYRQDKLGPQPKIQKWTEKTAPKAFPRDSPLPEDSPYTMTMRGKIAGVIIFPSGPGTLAMSEDEYKKVKSEYIAGLKSWVDKAPASAGLSFATYSGIISITASDGQYGCSYEGCHNVFATPALKACGFNSNDDAAKWVKDKVPGAVGAFVAFISKYRQKHFAYAYFEGGPLYMQHSNDGWGSDQIDRVFAHEVGHVFNAPDEYTNCKCSNNYGRGSCTAKNSNCDSCTSRQQSCIMDSNDLGNICAYSKKHVGWC